MKKIKQSWLIALILFIGFQTNALATSCWVTMFPTPSCEGPMTREGSDQRECEVFMGGTWYPDSDDCTAGVGLSSATPANGDKHVALDENLELVFAENVVAGSGTIELKNSSDDSTVESFDITDASDATISADTLTLLKSTPLVKENTYYLTIPSTAIVSSSDNSKTFQGYSDSSGLAFSTNYKPTLIDLSDLQLNFNGVTHSIDLNPLMDKDSDSFTVTATSNNSNIATLIINKFQQRGSDIDGEAAIDVSGKSVALSSDGSIVAIGANGNDRTGDGAGHVRVYQNNNGTWTQVGSDIDGEAAGDQSGVSVAISGDGSIVAIGAYNNGGTASQAGHVRVYQNISGTWTKIGSDIDGEAGGDHSGNSVALSNDGSIVAIGAHWNDGTANGSGHVRVYQNISGTWTKIGSDIDGEALGDHSGESVAISGDGSIVAVGASENHEVAYRAGHVRVYQNNSGAWTKIGSDIDGKAGSKSGTSVAISNDGSIIAIGAPGGNSSSAPMGYVRVYQNINGTWTKIGSDIDGEEENDKFGTSVSISGDGSIVSIGAPENSDYSGYVKVYKNVSGTWTQMINTLDGEAGGDQSGNSVALSKDGSVLGVGASANDGAGDRAGHVRVYSLTNNLNITPKTDAEGVATVTVSANDGYDTVSKSFTLTVGNPVAPTDITLSSATIPENSTSGTTIGTLSITDNKPSENKTFSLGCSTTGAHDGNFTISGNTLSSNAIFDYETTTSQNICIKVVDSENMSFEKNLTITITDADESLAGQCGTANQSTFSSSPTNGLCMQGDPSSVSLVNNSYNWSCAGTTVGVHTGNSVACSATAQSSQSGGSNSGDNNSNGNTNTGSGSSDGNTSGSTTTPTLHTQIPDQLIDVNNTQNFDLNISDYFSNVTTYQYSEVQADHNISDWLEFNSSNGNLRVKDGMDNNSSLLGKYFIKVLGLDSSDNNATGYFTIRVKDIVSSLDSSISRPVGATLTSGTQGGKRYTQVIDGNSQVEVFDDGSVKHNIQGIASATSYLPDSEVSINQNGDVNTTTTTINEDGEEIDIVVEGKASGDIKAKHMIKLEDGNITQAISKLLNSITTILSDRSVETNTTISGNTLQAKANPDGTAEHIYNINGLISKAVSYIKGALTTLSSSGIDTEVTYGDKTYLISTDTEGKSVPKKDGKEIIDTTSGDKLPAGTIISIKENGTIEINATLSTGNVIIIKEGN